MLSAFRMGPAAKGRGLCDIDRVLFGLTKSRVKKCEVLVRRKYTDYNPSCRYTFIVQGHPNFPTRDLVTPNNTLSISHSPRPLAAGPIRNVKIMFVIDHNL